MVNENCGDKDDGSMAGKLVVAAVAIMKIKRAEVHVKALLLFCARAGLSRITVQNIQMGKIKV